ncbi:MAG: phosphodiester glycosidase family protein [Solobacterium sp.]|nr:phosphodiester glycosidase family protein [Solobacterium sp.]
MKSMKRIALGITSLCLMISFSVKVVRAEEVENAWDEQTRVHLLRRKVATAVNVYTDGIADDITHEEGVIDDVIYDILRVTPSEHTFLQVDYSETPKYVNEMRDPDTIARGYQYAGGINAGYFSNTEDNYGRPVGAVRRNHAWTSWYGEENTPAYGNGFATAYIDDEDLTLRYHGWANGMWNGDTFWQWWTGYTMEEAYAVSGSFTYYADGVQQDITHGDHGEIDYRTFGRAVTILAQKMDHQYLLITLYGTVEEERIVEFLGELGVCEAIRLDGGGSTQMVYETDLVRETEPELSWTKESIEEDMDNPIGYVSVHVDKLRVRSGHQTTSLAKGEAVNGERYQVYDIYEDGTYTWYRIGNRRWIAGTDDWVTYEEIVLLDKTQEKEKSLTVTVLVENLNIRDGAGIDRSMIGVAVNGKSYQVYETIQNQGYTWYRIGEQEWIAGNPDWVKVTEE